MSCPARWLCLAGTPLRLSKPSNRQNDQPSSGWSSRIARATPNPRCAPVTPALLISCSTFSRGTTTNSSWSLLGRQPRNRCRTPSPPSAAVTSPSLKARSRWPKMASTALSAGALPSTSLKRSAQMPMRRSRSAPALPSAAFRPRLVNLSACPMNGANLAATIVHWLTFKELPATDSLGRPLFAHGDRIHDNCPRRAHYDAGQFVQEWGDEGHRQGWCLYKMGCKGPATDYNCPRIQWNDGTNWPIGVGHGCVGCAQPAFWDTMSPFYRALPNVGGFGIEATAEEIGIGVVATVATLTAAHAVGTVVKKQIAKSRKAEPISTGGVPSDKGTLAASNEATWKWPTQAPEE